MKHTNLTRYQLHMQAKYFGRVNVKPSKVIKDLKLQNTKQRFEIEDLINKHKRDYTVKIGIEKTSHIGQDLYMLTTMIHPMYFKQSIMMKTNTIDVSSYARLIAHETASKVQECLINFVTRELK